MNVDRLITADILLAAGHTALRLAAILIGAWLVGRFGGLLIERLFLPPAVGKKLLEEKRARTLSALLKSILRYTIYFIAAVLILNEFHVDTTSIIASAGIIGLAVGVGAQGLVKDFITGFFIIFENQYTVGDYIVSGDMAGTVEELTFRVTKLRDGNGVLHIIPNSAITRVSNYTRGHMQAVINIPVAYDADIGRVLTLLEEVADDIARLPEVLERPTVVGVVDLRPGEAVVRIVAKTVPLEQMKVEAACRRKIIALFEEAHIPAPAAAMPWRGQREEKP